MPKNTGNNSTKNFWLGGALIGAALTLVLLQNYLSQPEQEINWLKQPECQLSATGCTLNLGEGKSLHLKLLNSATPQALTPLPLEVTLTGFNSTDLATLQLEADLQGRDMYMGYNRVPMQATAANIFQASPIISLCTEQKMVWRLSILASSPQNTKPWGITAFFTVTKN